MANLSHTYVEVARALTTPDSISLTHSYVEVARSLATPDSISLTHAYVEVARSLIEPPVVISTGLVFDADLSASLAVEVDLEDQLVFNAVVSGFAEFDGELEEEIQFTANLATPSAVNLSHVYVEVARSLTTPDSISLTHSYVEVARALATPDSISLTHSYVEVARSLIEPPVFITADLDLDVEVVGSLDIAAEIEDQLVFNATITTPEQFDEVLEEEIQFVATFASTVFELEFSEVVVFDAEIEIPLNPVDADFAETIVFDATISEERVFDLEINVEFEPDVTLTACHVLNLEFSEDLTNEQVVFEFDEMGVGGEIITVDLDTTIQLQECFRLDIVESLILDGVMNGYIVRPGPEDQIDESITFEDRMVISTLTRFDDVVVFSDEMSAIVAQTFEEELVCDGTFESQACLNAGVVEVLDFQIIMTSVIESDTCRFDTRQFPAYVDPTDDPALGDSGTVRLVSPAEGPVSSLIQLKAPNFQNRHNIAPTRTVNETRLGELIIFANQLAGPPVETLLLSFSGLKREQVRMVEQWHDDHLGQQIRLVDHEDRVWIGFISVVDDPGVEDRKMSYTLSFQFQGSLV